MCKMSEGNVISDKKGDRCEGKWIYNYHDTGSIQFIKIYEEHSGFLCETRIEYYENGNKKSDGRYVDGNCANGMYNSYNVDGNLVHSEYLENGNKIDEKYYYDTQFAFLSGKKSPQIKSSIHYMSQNKDLMLFTVTSTGATSSVRLSDCTYTEYYECKPNENVEELLYQYSQSGAIHGTPKVIGQYLRDVKIGICEKIGTWEYYDISGNKISTIEFKYGNISNKIN